MSIMWSFFGTVLSRAGWGRESIATPLYLVLPPLLVDLPPLEHKIDFFHNESGAHQNQILHTHRAT
jgi:hypothetical protein